MSNVNLLAKSKEESSIVQEAQGILASKYMDFNQHLELDKVSNCDDDCRYGCHCVSYERCGLFSC